jgi:hypothetical protein
MTPGAAAKEKSKASGQASVHEDLGVRLIGLEA